MAILNRYVSNDFLVTFLMTLMIFTFVMCIGAVVKAIDLVSRGVSGDLIIKVFLYNIPYLMTFSMPMSVMTSILLLFSKLSFDGEITAMKACGLSIWQIIAPVLLLSVAMTVFCTYLNTSAAPKSHYARRQLIASVKLDDPMSLLEEGRFVRDFPGLLIYVGNKSGNKIKDVVVYEMKGPVIESNVRAQSGQLTLKEASQELIVDLYDVRIDQPDPNHPMDPSKAQSINAAHYPVKIDLKKFQGDGKVRQKASDMTFTELIQAVRNVREKHPDIKEEDIVKERMKLIVEANKRLALSLTCFAFAMLGIPLGMRSRRKESSVGIGISLLLVFFFYFFIIVVTNAMVEHPNLRPDLFVWVPVIVAELAGYLMIRRIN